MTKYIEQEAAMNACKEAKIIGLPQWNSGVECVEEKIKKIPTADVVERLRWIPVTERLPDIGSNCLIFPISGCVAEGQFDGDGWTQYRWSAKLDKDTVTHWMPMPEWWTSD